MATPSRAADSAESSGASQQAGGSQSSSSSFGFSSSQTATRRAPAPDDIRAELGARLSELSSDDVSQMVETLAEAAAVNVYNSELSDDQGPYKEDPRLRTEDGTLVQSGAGTPILNGDRGARFDAAHASAREAMAEFVPAYLESVREQLAKVETPEVARYAAAMEKLDDLHGIYTAFSKANGEGLSQVEERLAKLDFPEKADALKHLDGVRPHYEQAALTQDIGEIARALREDGLTPETLERIEELGERAPPVPGSFAEVGLQVLQQSAMEAAASEKSITPEMLGLVEQGSAAAAKEELAQANGAFKEYGGALAQVLRPTLEAATAKASLEFDALAAGSREVPGTAAAFSVREALAGRLPGQSDSLTVVRQELGPDSQNYSNEDLSKVLGSDLVQQIARDGLPQAAVDATQSLLQDQAAEQGLGGAYVDKVTATAALGEAMAVSGQDAVLNVDLDSGLVQASAGGDSRGLVVDAAAVRETAEHANDQAHESAQRGVEARESDEHKEKAAAEAEMSMGD